MPSNSDDYMATLLAMGPGLIPCTMAAVVEFLGLPLERWTSPMLVIESLGTLQWWTSLMVWCVLLFAVYLAVLVVSLPSLPWLGLCVARVMPTDAAVAQRWSVRQRFGWLLVSSVVSMWYVGVYDLGFRLLCPWRSPVDWWVVLRFNFYLWAATWGCWLCYARRVRHRSERSA